MPETTSVYSMPYLKARDSYDQLTVHVGIIPTKYRNDAYRNVENAAIVNVHTTVTASQ